MRAAGYLALLLAVCFGRAAAAIPKDDGVRARLALGHELRQLLREEKFPELDRRATDYAAKKEAFADGWWKLTEFFVALEGPDDPNNEAAWPAHLGTVERWVAASSGGATARTAQARTYARYAWAARGSGYADTVSEAGWKLFAERLTKARDILASARARQGPAQKPGAGWYSTMLTIALGQNWEMKEYDQVFDEAVAAHPDYFEFYLKKAHRLLPRWGGAEGEWQKFARDTREKAGLETFTRVCWANGQTEGLTPLFTTLGITWEEMDAGFTALRKKFPNSAWTLNYHCRMAVAARKRDAARMLFNAMGDDVYPEAWSASDYYERARLWALGPRAVAP